MKITIIQYILLVILCTSCNSFEPKGELRKHIITFFENAGKTTELDHIDFVYYYNLESKVLKFNLNKSKNVAQGIYTFGFMGHHSLTYVATVDEKTTILDLKDSLQSMKSLTSYFMVTKNIAVKKDSSNIRKMIQHHIQQNKTTNSMD
jgi:hypothetical protein